MPTEIDALSISIETKAQKANSSIDKLVSRLDVLSNSLGKLQNGSNNLVALGRGVESLSRGMQGFKGVGEAKFIRLANGINQLANINTQGLNNAASSLSHMTRAFNNIGAVSQNAVQVSDLAKNLGKLGNKSVTNAITNIPKLATGINNLMTTLSKAPKVSENVIRMTNALANLSAQGAKVGSASNSIVRGLNRASNSATRARASFGGLASVIGKFYATYFLFFRAFRGLWKSINMTADYVESFNYFTVSMGKIASKWDENWENYGDQNARNYSNKFFTTLNKTFSKLSGVSYDPQTGLLSETGLQNLGLNLQEVTQYAAQLSSMMDAVGQSGEVTLATTNAFVKLAGDISSLFNIDYQDAADKIRSVLQGQSRAGYGFGWDTTAAALQETAEKFGITKAVSEMAQWEKQQLRILTILEQSKVAYGDQSNTINTLANQIRLFKNNIKEAGMLLGQLFVPMLTKIMPIVNGVTIAIKRLLSSIATLLGIEIKDIGQGFSDLDDGTEDLSDGLDDVAKSAKKAYMGLLGFDKLNVIKSPDTSTSGTGNGAGGGGIDLTDEILAATEEYEKVWQEAFSKIENKAQDFADEIEKLFAPITEPFANLDWETITTNIKELSTALEPWTDNFGEGFIDFWGDIAEISATAIEKLFGEDGAATDLTDWLNNNDPEKAKDWGYALGVLSFGLLGFGALAGVSGIITTLGKAFAFIFSPLSKLFKLIAGSTAWLKFTTFLTNLGSTFVQMGGLVGILTADIGAVFASGSAMAIGLTIGTGIIAGILTAWAGFKGGKWLGKELFPEDAEWYDNFTWFKEGGFFDSIGNAGFANTLIAISDMFTDILSIGSPLSSVFKMLHSNFEEIVRATEEGGALAGVKEYFNQFVKNIETFGFSILDTVDTIKEWANSALDVASDFVEKLQNLFSDALFNIENMFGSTKFNFNIGGLGKIGDVGSGIKGFATGGFPNEYSLFMAGERGHAEMLGTVGGKTAVAGGAEITGIREEIRNTANEEIALLRQQNALLQGILEKEFGISTDAVGRAAQSWARDYSRRTGRPAY